MTTSRKISWAGHAARIREFFVGKPEGKRTLGRPRRRWEDNIKTVLTETVWKVVD
jgi:hypothetical protein